MGPLFVQIITPERVVSELTADMVVIPSKDGEMGILPGHAPVLSELIPGAVRIRQESNVEFFAVSGGFVQVDKSKVIILAETAEMAQEIDEERARQSAERARAQLNQPVDAATLAAAEASLKRALVRLQLSQVVRKNDRVRVR